MEKAQGKKPTLQNIFRWIIQSLGTFLYVFFMMAAIIVFTTNIKGTVWLMPCFILPAYLICITFGADYWVGDNVVRRWSYCISTIISVALLLPYFSWMMSYYVTSTALGFFATFLLPIIPIIYGIWLVRKRERNNQKADKAIETPQSMHMRMNLRKVIRVLCLLSICCVLFENWHRAILIIYHHFTSDGITLIPGLITLPLSILSAILLGKFVKAEFVQWKPSLD